MDCALNIKEARKAKRLTQSQLACEIGKGLSTVQKYELGLAIPSLDVLGKIAAVLGVSTGFLLYGPQFFLYGDGKVATPPTTAQIGRAYEKAPAPVRRTVDVALEPYMDKEIDPNGET